jgi:hypothetical protein
MAFRSGVGQCEPHRRGHCDAGRPDAAGVIGTAVEWPEPDIDFPVESGLA